MKKTLAVLATFAVAVGAFAQGKVLFGNANHPVTLNSDGNLVKAGYTAGTAAPQAGSANDVLGLLTAQLWGGETAATMTLQSTVASVGLAGLDPGIFRNTSVTLTGVDSTGDAFFQIFLWETTAGSYAAAQNRQPTSEAERWWYGSTAVFTAVPGAFAANPLANSAGWPNGPITLSANAVPEPSTFVLAGLGIASLLLFRRRK